MDGIDVALLRSDGMASVKRGPNMFVPYNDDIRVRITAGLNDASLINKREERPGKLDTLEQEITEHHINAVIRFLETNQILASDVDVVGFHGQTVLHRPQDGLTVQLGNGQELANAIGIAVVYEMRANDMEHGGQGAPLVPAYHRALTNSMRNELQIEKPLAFVNIGGISNVTFVGKNDELIAFDSGPGNTLIDQWVQQKTDKSFDEGGEIASAGKIINSICDDYLSHVYFGLSIPKSLDRNDFAPLRDESVSVADGARSLSHITAKSIMRSSEHFSENPKTWIICGGGTLNKVIMSDLRELADATDANVVTADEVGFDSMALEAEAFGYLAIRSMLGMEMTWPTTTGCENPVTGGIHVSPVC